MKAEANGDDALAVEANKGLMPYAYAKLRVIEADLTGGDLGERLAAARARVQALREHRAALVGPAFINGEAPRGTALAASVEILKAKRSHIEHIARDEE